MLFLCLAAAAARREFDNQAERRQMRDAGELNTDEAFLLCQDFVTEIVNAFMPEAKPWCERGPAWTCRMASGKVEQEVRKKRPAIFGAMKASNLYPESAKAFYPDLAIGTVGMWIERPHSVRRSSVSAIPAART
jgi:hypothetical protein